MSSVPPTALPAIVDAASLADHAALTLAPGGTPGTGKDGRVGMAGAETGMVDAIAVSSKRPGSPHRSDPVSMVNAPLQVPLAAVGYNPALKLSDRQTGQLARMGQAFLAEVGDEADASGPADQAAEPATAAANKAADARWRSAQQRSDEQFKAMFGYQAFNAQQILRMRQESQAQPAGK